MFSKQLLEICADNVFFNHSLKDKNTFGVGGNAKYYAQPTNLKQVALLTNLCNNYKVKYKVIGNGSNLLISDNGFNGLIIAVSNLTGIKAEHNVVTALCGTKLIDLISFCATRGLGGLEKLSGIPATVGGAIYMNASAFGCNISDNLLYVNALKKGKPIKYQKEEMKFGYKKSIFMSEGPFIIDCTFRLDYAKTSVITKNKNTAHMIRNATQPKGRSCGSVFKNGKDYYSAELIEKAGLKGLKVGGAEISSVHSNFILANSSATAKDIYTLIQTTKEKINKIFNVSLVEEVEYIGEF